jgi:ankyrin repeat protein
MRGTRLLVACLALVGVHTNAASDVERARQSIRTKQFAEAVAILRQEAQSGSPEADYLLGLASWNGIGVAADRDVARAALRRAAEGGHAPAAHALAALLCEGSSADRAEAGQWLKRAATAGYSPAVALQSAHSMPLADARTATGPAVDLRFEFARAAARRDDESLLSAVINRELASRRGEFGRTLLFDAAAAGAMRTMRLLLATGAAVDGPDEYGETALMIVAAQPDVTTTRLLLGAGARVDAVDRAGRTALFRAAAADRSAQVGVLLKAGANIDHSDAQGATAFDLAIRNEAVTALAALRAAGGRAGAVASAAPRAATGMDSSRTGLLYKDWPPLAVAATRDDAAEVSRLIAAGAGLDAGNPLGLTALEVALATRSIRAARVLIDAGASLAHRSPDGIETFERIARTGDAALLAAARMRMGADFDVHGARLVAMAARRDDAAMARALLEAGAPVTGIDAERMTPLMYAARGSNAELVREFMARGAPVEARDVHGRTALWYAAASGNGTTVGALIGVRAAADAADRYGATPLVAAIRAGSPTAVERLLAAGANIDVGEANLLQPLRVAVEIRSAAIVAALLKRKPELDAVDAFGETALMAAARNGDTEISAQLLAAGANSRLRNRDRATAAELAEWRGFAALAQRLRD